MNLKILSMFVVGMFLMTCLTATSAVGMKVNGSEDTYSMEQSKRVKYNLPDLIIDVEAKITTGVAFLEWRCKVTNIGDASVTVDQKIVVRGILTYGDSGKNEIQNIDASIMLEPGEYYKTYGQFGLASLIPEGSIVTVFVDPDDQIDEINNDNNKDSDDHFESTSKNLFIKKIHQFSFTNNFLNKILNFISEKSSDIITKNTDNNPVNNANCEQY
jgi:hypothetical protein